MSTECWFPCGIGGMVSMVRNDHALEYSGGCFMTVEHAVCILNG